MPRSVVDGFVARPRTVAVAGVVQHPGLEHVEREPVGGLIRRERSGGRDLGAELRVMAEIEQETRTRAPRQSFAKGKGIARSLQQRHGAVERVARGLDLAAIDRELSERDERVPFFYARPALGEASQRADGVRVRVLELPRRVEDARELPQRRALEVRGGERPREVKRARELADRCGHVAAAAVRGARHQERAGDERRIRARVACGVHGRAQDREVTRRRRLDVGGKQGDQRSQGRLRALSRDRAGAEHLPDDGHEVRALERQPPSRDACAAAPHVTGARAMSRGRRRTARRGRTRPTHRAPRPRREPGAIYRRRPVR